MVQPMWGQSGHSQRRLRKQSLMGPMPYAKFRYQITSCFWMFLDQTGFLRNCYPLMILKDWVSFQILLSCLLEPEVPARLCKRLQDAASHESSGGTAKPSSGHSNVARNAYRSIRRWGIAWRVKLDVYNYHCEDGSVLPIHYLHPKKLIEYLVRCHPVVVFGTPDACKARESLLAFWEGYQQYHPTHAAFSLGVPMEQLIPVVLHGDEGRGKRRSNTTVFSWESPIGIKGHSSVCTACAPTGSWSPQCAQGHPFKSLLRSNMKSHSFLQHWPMFLLPGTLWKNYKMLTLELITFLSGQFETLFHDGFAVNENHYRVVVVGSKGDLKWVSKIASLTRGFENKGKVRDAACCHQCLAGSSQDLAFEDISQHPVWEATLHVERPYSPNRLPCLHQIPFDSTRPELIYRHDCFHNLRLGLYRDFAASTIFLWVRWGYFGRSGQLPDKLIAAHGHFSLWATTTSHTPALRSFSTQLFNYKNASSYVWANTKGSDTTLLCKWIATACAGFIHEETDPQRREVLSVILSASRLATDWFNLLYTHGALLSRKCGANLYERARFPSGLFLACFILHEQ